MFQKLSFNLLNTTSRTFFFWMWIFIIWNFQPL